MAFGVWNPIASHLEHYMDLASFRQRLVAANVANAATPGYRTQDIDFQSEFRNLIESGATGSPHVVEAAGLPTGNDGNNVSLDRESRLMAESALRFNIASQLWRSELRQLRNAIQEGRNG
jgi:flagellar basal-body rod protein FlgB